MAKGQQRLARALEALKECQAMMVSVASAYPEVRRHPACAHLDATLAESTQVLLDEREAAGPGCGR